MDKSDFNTFRNTAASVKPSRTNAWFILLFLLLFFSFNGVAQIGPNCNSLCFGPGGNVVVDSNTTLTISVNTFYDSIIVRNNGKLIVQANSILYVGKVNTLATTQVVDFNNGCNVTIETEASLVVNGLLNNSNNSNGVTFNGSVSVTGNVTAGVGSIIDGIGTLNTTGSIATDGTGSIFGSSGDCPNGPCSGSQLNCSGETNTINGDQTICSGSTPTPLSGSTAINPATYQWQQSTTSGANFINISGAISSNYSPGSLTTTTYYRRNKTVGGCTGTSAQVTVTVNALPTTAAAGTDQSKCNTTTFTLAGNAPTTGSGLWTVLSGTASITTPTSNISGVTGIIAGTSATLRWTISNGGCTPSTDDVILTNNATPTTPAAGVDQTNCNSATFTLVGNAPSIGTGLWTLVSGTASIITPTSNTSGVTGVPVGTSATLRWTISNGACAVLSDEVVLTNNALPTNSNAGADQSNCNTETFTLAGNTATTGIGTWTKVSGAATITITSPTSPTSGVTGITAGTSATLRWTISNGACSSIDDVILANNALPTVSFTAQPGATACSDTDVTYTTQASQTNYVWSFPGVLNTDYTITSGGLTSSDTVTLKWLTSGSKTVTVNYTNSSGCPAAASSIASTVNINKRTAAGWTLGTPTSEQSIVFDSNFISDADITACSCTVNSGTVTIRSGNTMTLTNSLSVSGGSLTFEDTASLVQTNDTAVNTGVIVYKRANTSAIEEDYTYWSSPVANQKLIDVSPLTPTNYFYSFNPSANDWVREITDNTMNFGQGYIIRNPYYTGTTPPLFYLISFKGTPNNGEKTISTIVADASYLLGNPYPSAIDADLFLLQNQNTLVGTLYFWTHNTAIQDRANFYNTSNNTTTAGEGALAYTSNDYATYNITGGVGVIDTGAVTGSAPSDPNHSVLGLDKGIKPTGKIAAGQGFFASSLLSATQLGDIVFNNSMRLAGTTLSDGTGVNQQFFRTSSTAKAKTASALEKHRIWLDLKNSQGAFKQTLVGYISGATNDYDNLFDGESYDGNDFVDFYSINQDKNLTIQGRAVPFDENDTVPLGFKTTIDGSFTINIDQVDGDLTNQAVYLEDKVTNTLTNLKTGDYTFTTATGTFDDRFVLRYTDKTLGLNDTDKADRILVFYSNNYKTLIIKNNVMDATVNSVVLFNTTGQRIANFDIKESGQTNLQIPIKNIPSGIYIVKVKTTKGESSKKVIVN